MVWIWQYDKRTDDYKIILNCVRKLMKTKSEKEAGKGPRFFKKNVLIFFLIGRVFSLPESPSSARRRPPPSSRLQSSPDNRLENYKTLFFVIHRWAK